MMAKSWYLYTTDTGTTYELGAEFMISNRRVKLIGCDLYDTAGQYKGYWNRENMPMWLVRQVEHWLKGDANAAALMMRNSTSFSNRQNA